MKELSYEAAITLKIPGTDYGMAKPSVRFTIDADGDVAEQIEQHKAALEELAPAVEESLAQQLANITGLAVEGYGLSTKVDKLAKLLDFTVAEMKKQKATLKELTPKKSRSGSRKKE
jgi:peptidoglycan hydrolase CwlO-like protein